MRRSAFMVVATVAASLLIFGCQGKEVPASGTHAPTNPATIKLYQKAPKETYQNLGRISITDNLKWGEGFDVTPAVEAMKAKAAAKGANGILLKEDEKDPNSFLVGGFYQGTFWHFPFRQQPTREAYGTAIWVESK